MPLSDVKIKNAKAAAKPMKLFDERGLFLAGMFFQAHAAVTGR